MSGGAGLEYLPIMHSALDSTLSTLQKNNRVMDGGCPHCCSKLADMALVPFNFFTVEGGGARP